MGCLGSVFAFFRHGESSHFHPNVGGSLRPASPHKLSRGVVVGW